MKSLRRWLRALVLAALARTLERVVDVACGGATPCEETADSRRAQQIVRARWAPLIHTLRP